MFCMDWDDIRENEHVRVISQFLVSVILYGGFANIVAKGVFGQSLSVWSVAGYGILYWLVDRELPNIVDKYRDKPV